MDKSIPGIHHVTAVTGDLQQNIDFYAGVLGLRLVKITVDFDEPEFCHLYYGDGLGRPGSVITFFGWPGVSGVRGTGQVKATAFSVPKGALGYWRKRLHEQGLTFKEASIRFEEEALVFEDPDGLELEIVAGAGDDERSPWADGPVPADNAIRGLYSAALSLADCEPTAKLLVETLGFRRVGEQGNRLRYETGTGGPGAIVDLLCEPDVSPGKVAVGTVHHIAWRTPNDEEEQAWRQEIGSLGYDITNVRDRNYFHSIYFDEPGGVLFEIATDVPGFATDETPENLGTGLKLPPRLEASRLEIEARLPRLRLPGKAGTILDRESV